MATDHGHQYLIARQFLLGHLHEVFVQYDQVGEFTHLKRTQNLVQIQLLRGVEGDGAYYLGTRQRRVCV